MTTKPPPSNEGHLSRLIDAWANDPDADTTAKRLRRLIAVSVLVAMLDGLNLDGEPRLAVKGGASMELRFGPTARSSRDVDTTTSIDLDDAFIEIADRLHAGWEGFTGVLGERTLITRPGVIPPPERANIHLRYKGKPFAKVPFEIARAEAGSFRFIEYVENAVSLERAQLGPTGEIAVLGVHYQIAQKLHACTETPDQGTNQRAHDLYDIALLAELARADGLDQTRVACIDTFEHRAKHTWPPSLTDWPDWPLIWDGLDLPSTAALTYSDARDRVQDLITEIDRADLQD